MAAAVTADRPERRSHSRRAFWIRQAVVWHWMSSAVCLGAMLLFTVTGITLNHAAQISSTPEVTKRKAQLPGKMAASLREPHPAGQHPVSAELLTWLLTQFPEKRLADTAEWSDAEVYLSLPRPGGDGWITIDRETGEVEWERTDRGWISWFNDLHKGRHTGVVWQVFIDVVAVAFLVFTATGFILLQVHSAKRPFTWPTVAFGFALPVLLLFLFMHR